jgi:lipoprotein-anchoring transpeptidase ErfK/SrfK
MVATFAGNSALPPGATASVATLDAVLRRLLLLIVGVGALGALMPVAVAGAQEERRIAAGLSAAGVDLSGLTVTEAAARLDATLGPAINQDLVLGVAGRPWRLTVADARLKLDSRSSTVATVPPVPLAVPVALSHSRGAVRTFVEDVARRVRVAPRDATITIGLRKIFRKRSKAGRALDVEAARRLVDGALDDAAAPRVLHQALTKLRPDVTADELPRLHRTIITVDRSSFKLRLFKGLKLRKTYGIAVGAAGYDTPRGLYRIQNRQVNPPWTAPNRPWAGALAGKTIPGGLPNNPLKARWLGIANGVGIHGTGEPWSIGTRASHGCIRMRVPDVIDLYPRVPVGTQVLIR